MNKTKTVEMWCDLAAGWQDCNGSVVYMSQVPLGEKGVGIRRIKVVVELPCFGGSAEMDLSTTGTVASAEEAAV